MTLMYDYWRQLAGASAGICCLVFLSPAVASENPCPWVVRDVSARVAVEDDNARALSITYFATGHEAQVFYGFSFAAGERASHLPDFERLSSADAGTLDCHAPPLQDAGEKHCMMTATERGTSNLYLVAATNTLPVLEAISARFEPVQLVVRGATDFSGPLPGQLVPVAAGAGNDHRAASSFQICAFQLN